LDYHDAFRHHHTCGTAPFSEGIDPCSGPAMVKVNACCLPGVNLGRLTITRFDGASQ